VREDALGDRVGAGLRQIDDVELPARGVEMALDRAGSEAGYEGDVRVSLAPASPQQHFALASRERVYQRRHGCMMPRQGDDSIAKDAFTVPVG
jgi:hypothetical protein